MTRSILEDLYYGDIIPFDHPSKASACLVKEYEAKLDELLSIIPAEHKPKLEELDDLNRLVNSESNYNTFSYGFRLASLIMVEVFKGESLK